MSFDHGLSRQTIEHIHEVFERYKVVEKAVLYGSRAKGTFREGSDIDLTLFGDVDFKTLSQIVDDIDELMLPYLFDISVYSSLTNNDLRGLIDRVGKIIYQRTWSMRKEP